MSCPTGGLPRGVVELAAPRALGGSTSVALAAVRAGQARAKGAWCAWLDPESTLHAPGVVAAGVDLARMLVVRPPRAQLGRVAVKVTGAGAFEVVVIDFDAVPGASRADAARGERDGGAKKRKTWAPEVLVRKLALSAEASGTTILLLTDSLRPRPMQWPVALRLELSRPNRDDLVVRVAKDRRGRIGVAKTVPFLPAVPVARAGTLATQATQNGLQVESCVVSRALPFRRSASRSPAKGRVRARRREARRRSPSSSLVREVPSGTSATSWAIRGSTSCRERLARPECAQGRRWRLRARSAHRFGCGSSRRTRSAWASRAWPRWPSRSVPRRRSTSPPTSSGSKPVAAPTCTGANTSSRKPSTDAFAPWGTRVECRSPMGLASRRRSRASRRAHPPPRIRVRPTAYPRARAGGRCADSPSRRSIWTTSASFG